MVIEVRSIGRSLRLAFLISSSIFFESFINRNIIKVSFITIPISPTNPNIVEKVKGKDNILCPINTPKSDNGITDKENIDNLSELKNHVKTSSIPKRANIKLFVISFFTCAFFPASPFIFIFIPCSFSSLKSGFKFL